MKKIFSLTVFATLASALVIIFATKNNPTPTQNPQAPPSAIQTPQTKTPHTAKFAIFTNGTFRVFTASMYHNLSPDVYIEKSNPNIVHVQKPQITWNDFFRTLPMTLTKDCLTTGTKETFCNNENGTLQFFLNGTKVENLLDRTIMPSDQALISYGQENQKEIEKESTKLQSL